MRPFGVFAVLVLWLLLSAARAGAQPVAGKGKVWTQKEFAELMAPLDEITIETKHFKEMMTLPEFLAEVEKQIPAGKKLSLRIDKAAFGKTYQDLAASKIRIPAFPKMVSVRNAVNVGLQLSAQTTVTADCAYVPGPGHIEITTLEKANITVRYDVSALIAKTEQWRPRLLATNSAIKGPTAPPGSEKLAGMEFLVEVICYNIQPGFWKTKEAGSSTIMTWNAKTLEINTPAFVHYKIVDFLDELQELADLAVVMEAGLYAVEQQFYEKQVSILITQAKHKDMSSAVLRISKELADKVRGQELVMKGDNGKILDGSGAVILARQQALSYISGDDYFLDPGVPEYRTILHGVSFHAQVHVSPTNHWLQLKLTQSVKDLIEVKKTEVVDLRTGGKREVESPNLREVTLSATLIVEDGQPLLMPVAYQTPEAKAKNRVLVLLLTPRVVTGAEPNGKKGDDKTPMTSAK